MVAPEWAVGRPEDGGVVAAEVLSGGEAGAGGESDVVFGEAFLRGGWGGDEEDGAGAEAEEENRAMLGGEFCEGSVEGLL